MLCQCDVEPNLLHKKPGKYRDKRSWPRRKPFPDVRSARKRFRSAEQQSFCKTTLISSRFNPRPKDPRAGSELQRESAGHFFLHAVLRATRVPPRLRPTCRYRSRRASLPRSRTTTEDVRPVRRRVPPSSARLSCAPAKCVTSAFLAPNKQPNKSRVFSKLSS
jgi:hypothetical protein